MKKINLCVVGGGSGGHILPVIVLAKNWKKQNPNKQILFFGIKKKLDETILQNYRFLSAAIFLKISPILIRKFWILPKFCFQFLVSFFKSLYFLHKYEIGKIIATGAYLSIPVCLAGKILGCKMDLYELNVRPGRAIKLLSFFADKIYITFEKTMSYFAGISEKCFLREYPIRYKQEDKIFNKSHLISEINKKFLVSFSQDKKTIFLLGGSQGSLFLNEAFHFWISKNDDLCNNIQIIHQTRFSDLNYWKVFYFEKKIEAIIFSFEKNIKDFYLISDLVVSRAGAGTIFELEFFKKKSILIPLEVSSTLHQVFNAKEIASRNNNFSILLQNQIRNDFGSFVSCVERSLWYSEVSGK